MAGYNEIGVPAEQVALLKSHNFSIRPLSTAGHLDVWRVAGVAWLPTAIFVFCLGLLTAADFRYSSETLVIVLYYVGLSVLLLFPVIAAALVLVGVVAAGLRTRVRPSAAVYWTWWPFWRFALCAVAMAMGSCIGNHLWYHQFLPHVQMQRSQAYSQIDPRVVGSKRLQDAGLVAFNASAGVDRTRSGCLKNGATYCVAPILNGNQMVAPVAPAAAAPSASPTYPGNATNVSGAGNASEPIAALQVHAAPQELFMSGVDCCECPGEFRCGDWNVPQPLGGLRVLDPARRGFFALAAEEWAASHGQVLGQPMFFEWVVDPLAVYDEMRNRGQRLLTLALLMGPLILVLATVLLNGALALLCQAGWAAPLETPLPPAGMGRALSAHFLPQMYEHYSQQQAEMEGWHAPNPKYVIL